MQEAGTVLHLARSGRLIIKSTGDSPAKEGTILVDEQGRNAGRVLEILGPVSMPYLSAQPFTERIERIVGTKVFVSDSAPQDFRKKRHASRPGEFRNRPSDKRGFSRTMDRRTRSK